MRGLQKMPKGRTLTPQGYYINKKGESVHYQSGYEKRFMKWLDDNGFNWIKCKERFPYVDEEGKWRNYNPDIYLLDFELYVEIKGMIRKRDPLKFAVFPENKKLVLLEVEDLKKLGLQVFDPNSAPIDKNKWPYKLLSSIDDYSERGKLSEELKHRLYKYKYIFGIEVKDGM